MLGEMRTAALVAKGVAGRADAVSIRRKTRSAAR
jgi:hypothetical protein